LQIERVVLMPATFKHQLLKQTR